MVDATKRKVAVAAAVAAKQDKTAAISFPVRLTRLWTHQPIPPSLAGAGLLCLPFRSGDVFRTFFSVGGIHALCVHAPTGEGQGVAAGPCEVDPLLAAASSSKSTKRVAEYDVMDSYHTVAVFARFASLCFQKNEWSLASLGVGGIRR